MSYSRVRNGAGLAEAMVCLFVPVLNVKRGTAMRAVDGGGGVGEAPLPVFY